MKEKFGQQGEAMKQRKLSQRGQSMVEFAFLLPLFLLFVFAIIEIGRAWAVKQSLTIAAREGARILVLPYGAGLTYTSEGEVQTAATKTVRDSLVSSGMVGAGTQINIVRARPGSDGIYGTEDDPAPEVGYSNGKRGERVGIQIRYSFETPLPTLLRMFTTSNNANGINMGVTCYMDHE